MAKGISVEENNIPEYLDAVDRAVWVALESVGIKAEKYAKALCPVGTPESTKKKGYRGGTLRKSITHEVFENEGEIVLAVGSNVEYAPYVELGTGPYFDTPPEWEQFDTPKGSKGGHGYVRPRPYLKPAIMDHLDQYGKIIKDKLSNV